MAATSLLPTDPKGNKHGFNGTIHEFAGSRITRTFEMENGSFGVQPIPRI